MIDPLEALASEQSAAQQRLAEWLELAIPDDLVAELAEQAARQAEALQQLLEAG